MEIIYKVINEKAEKVGNVFLDNNKIIITNKSFGNEFNNIDEVFEYTKSNKLSLVNMQGDLYSNTIHQEVKRKINLFGIGCFIENN